jgi:hypothetical protein
LQPLDATITTIIRYLIPLILPVSGTKGYHEAELSLADIGSEIYGCPDYFLKEFSNIGGLLFLTTHVVLTNRIF